MTMDRTLPPPKEAMWHLCSARCGNEFNPYHGKVGCLCHDCDDKTPLRLKQQHDLTQLLRKAK